MPMRLLDGFFSTITWCDPDRVTSEVLYDRHQSGLFPEALGVYSVLSHEGRPGFRFVFLVPGVQRYIITGHYVGSRSCAKEL